MSSGDTNKLSVVIICKNEATNIARSIEAAQKITDDIIIVDSESTDETVTIAKSLNTEVHVIPWKGYGKSKNYGNSCAKYDWILSLDADEVLSDSLIDYIKDLSFKDKVVYAILIKMNFCGKWLDFSEMKPTWKKRLFNKLYVKWDESPVHENLILPKEFSVQKTNGIVEHYSYSSVEELEFKTDYYAQLAAQNLFENHISHNILKRIFAPYFRFIKSYFLQLGILEGKEGLLISKMSFKNVKLRYHYYDKLISEKSNGE